MSRDRIANIGLSQRRQRLMVGLVMGLAAGGLLVTIKVLGLPPALRLGVFFPAWIAAIGFGQHKEKT